MIIVGYMAALCYIFFSSMLASNYFETGSIGVEILTPEKIELLCNTTSNYYDCSKCDWTTCADVGSSTIHDAYPLVIAECKELTRVDLSEWHPDNIPKCCLKSIQVFDNTSRNSLGPYDNNSVYCTKSNDPRWDFIINLK